MIQDSTTVGVIGLGSIGFRHATNLQALGFDVVAHDPSLPQQERFKAQGGRIATKQEVIDESLWVVIASPSQYHKADLENVISASKHAFVEKPLSHTLSGLEQLANDARKGGLCIGMGLNMRHNPAIKLLHNKITNGELGDALWGRYWLSSYLPDWRPQNDYRQGYAADPKTGGIIFDAIHGFDVMHYLLGDYAVTSAQAVCSDILDIPSDDCADILCRHENGATTTLHMDFMSRPKTHTITVSGTAGRAEIDISNRILKIVDVTGAVTNEQSFAHIPVNEDYKEELRHFHEAIMDGAPAPCGIDEGIKILDRAITARRMAGLPHAD